MIDIRIPKGTEIETFTGRYVDLIDPQVEDLNVRDVAHHLSNICRYTGACRCFYSVAEHAVICAEWLLNHSHGYPPEVAYAALHHDDPEAYLQDISRPFKKQFQPRYGELTVAFQNQLAAAYGEPWLADAFEWPEVKMADNAALIMEAGQLLPSGGAGWKEQALNWELEYGNETMKPPAGRALGWAPNTAEQRYLELNQRLEDVL